MIPDEEYQKHYSPDGEKIEYLQEHPELNDEQPEPADWEKELGNMLDKFMKVLRKVI